MAVQNEGQVPFEKLPLRELKDWLEDWMDYPGVSLLGGGGGGGTGVTNITNQSDLRFMREPGIVVPQGRFGGVLDVVPAADDVLYSRFIAPKSGTATGVKVATKQVPTGTSKIDVGLYAANGTALLASSGAVAHPGIGSGISGAWESFSFTANTALTEGTEYVLAFLNKIDTGSWVYFGDNGFTNSLRTIYITANTVAGYIANGWQVRFAGTGWTSLQNGGPTGASVASTVDPPISVITVV